MVKNVINKKYLTYQGFFSEESANNNSKDFLKDYYKKYQQKSADDFELHRLKFKPVLDELTGKIRTIKKRMFFRSDIKSLLSKDKSHFKSHFKYHEQVLKDNRFSEPYKVALSEIGPSETEANNLKDILAQAENGSSLDHIFQSTSNSLLEDSVHLGPAIEIISHKIASLPEKSIEALITVSECCERQAFFTMEPYLAIFLGYTIFWNLFMPLHDEGSFTDFMRKCCHRQAVAKSAFYFKVKSLRTTFPVFWSMIKNNHKVLAIIYGSVVSLFPLFMIWENNSDAKVKKIKQDFTGARDLVDNLYEKNKGFESVAWNFVVKTIGKCTFEVGNVIRVFGEGFYAGFMSRDKEILKSGASSIDAYINKRK